MLSFITLATTLPLLLKGVAASPCVAFDANFNLYAFGLGDGSKDFSLGAQDSWASGSASDITASGRPPFDGSNTSCYLSQFFNAIYVLNGDKANPTNIGVYDVQGKSWSIQKTGTGSKFDYGNFQAILDHDTNVFYALSGTDALSLDFGQLKATANGDTINWNDIGVPSFSTDGYKPVMALAQNHIHFLNTPGAQPGSAQIFVIHFSFFQPDAQKYPIQGSSDNFPSTHGQATSIFKSEGVQEEFAFIPDDGSKTYVINVENNSTSVLSGPSDKSASTFAAGITSLVQLTSNGNIFFLPYKPGDQSTNSNAQWTQIKASGLPAAGSGSSSSSQSSSGGSKPTGTQTGSGSSSTNGAQGNDNGSAVVNGVNGVRFAGVVGLIAALACLM